MRQWLAGAGARGMLGEAFGITPDHPEFGVLRDEFFANYQACMTLRTRVFEGVEELVRRLTQNQLAWGVVTNKSARFTDPLTRALPLFASAGAVVSGDTTPHSKPHPAPLIEAAARLGIAPEHCIYVGDDERDMAAGRAAGMGTVAALYGYLGNDAKTQDWGADASVEHPMQCLDLLP